jgi:hypothetical protein
MLHTNNYYAVFVYFTILCFAHARVFLYPRGSPIPAFLNHAIHIGHYTSFCLILVYIPGRDFRGRKHYGI